MIKKIAITGPESTGKSTLCELLANYYKTLWVPEYSREYLARTDGKYEASDVLNIAQGQISKEKELSANANKYLFCDTELINTKIWCQHKFNHCPEWISENILQNKYELFMVCNIDIPWVEDPLRENPDNREYFFNWFIEELEHYKFPYKIISGNVFQRMEVAIKAINNTIF